MRKLRFKKGSWFVLGQTESVAQAGPPGLNSQPTALSHYSNQAYRQVARRILKATDEEISELFQGWEAQHPAKMFQTRVSHMLSVYSLSTGCVHLGTTGSGNIKWSLCLADFV